MAEPGLADLFRVNLQPRPLEGISPGHIRLRQWRSLSSNVGHDLAPEVAEHGEDATSSCLPTFAVGGWWVRKLSFSGAKPVVAQDGTGKL
jgi:hypothetical protein